MFRSFLVFLCLLVSGPAMAACYSQGQAEADQGIRIHSELMVIGLNCQHMGMRHGENLYMAYRDFTTRHSDLFSNYESTLLGFFKAQGEAKPEANLNALRTSYANTISKQAADMRPDVFCSNYAERISKAAAMSRDQVRQWAGTIYDSHPVSHPLCKAQG